MNRQDFLARLAAALASLQDAEVHKILVYYDEMISDRMEDGMTEQEAVASFGGVDALAQRILEETPFMQRVAAKAKTGNRGLMLVLLVLGFPIWFPLLMGAGALLIGLLVTLFALAVTVVILFVAFGFAGVVCICAGFVRFATLGFASGLFALGTGMVLAALGVFSWFLMVGGLRALSSLCGSLLRWVGSLFRRKAV